MSKKQIVYFIGAGFSAPLGLPVISNFMFKAKQQYLDYPDQYSYFDKVFKYIAELASAQSYLNVDLHNIEEIFSIADIQSQHSPRRKMKSDLELFIKDVIEHHTPKFELCENPRTNNKPTINITSFFGSPNDTHHLYLLFVLRMLRLSPEIEFQQILPYNPVAEAEGQWRGMLKLRELSVDDDVKFITLNYDTIIEDIIRGLSQISDTTLSLDNLAKLHGSVETSIVPPTWNKDIRQKNLKDDWKKAYQWLNGATDIRILGYSLPITDVYIKHLFTTALIKQNSLQNIDIISLDDSTASTEHRYRKMFNFPRLNYYNANIIEYLNVRHERFIDRH